LYYGSAFIVNVLIARHFLAAASGLLYYISSVYSLFLLFAGFSIESGIVYFTAKDKINTGKLLNFVLLWSLLTGILIFCIVFFFYKEFNTGIDKNFLLISSITFICGNLLITCCSGLFYAHHDFVTSNLLSLVINLVLILVFPFTGRSIVAGITDRDFFYIYFLSFFVQGIVLVVAVQAKYIRFRFTGLLSIAEFRLLFRYCAMAYLANIIFFLLYRIDYWFVERYCTPEQLGNYIQVSKIGQLFFILPTILAGAVFPLTAGGQREKVNRLLTMLSRSILLLYGIACIILLLTGKWLFPFVFGKSFSDMYQPFVLLIPGILSLSGLFIVTAYYAGKNRMSVNIKGSLLALVVIATADRIFIPAYGINAAALVSSIGYIVYQAYVLTVFKKEYQAAISDFFIFRITDWKELKNNLTRSIKINSEEQQ
jgi:O-antigen/teichoic acid export membrane protein